VESIRAIQATEGVTNVGQWCWGSCGNKGGPCWLCGTGMCCRHGVTGDGCDGVLGIAGVPHHVCVSSQTIEFDLAVTGAGQGGGPSASSVATTLISKLGTALSATLPVILATPSLGVTLNPSRMDIEANEERRKQAMAMTTYSDTSTIMNAILAVVLCTLLGVTVILCCLAYKLHWCGQPKTVTEMARDARAMSRQLSARWTKNPAAHFDEGLEMQTVNEANEELAQLQEDTGEDKDEQQVVNIEMSPRSARGETVG